MSVKVSVVVPVHQPGESDAGGTFDACVRSLLDQTLPRDEYEIVLVDAGSSESARARLDRLAIEHPVVGVLHTSYDGWPGTARNAGLDAATGEYVQLLEQDDVLAPDALRRLYELADRNTADVVVGKRAGGADEAPAGVFWTTRPACTVENVPLYESLTPDKMFRAEFLDRHEIRFPPGNRRLGDATVVLRAYLLADAVSVLGDYTCVYASVARDPAPYDAGAGFDPAGYCDEVREVLDLVDDLSKPGDLRVELLRRLARVEVLGPLSEPAMLDHVPTVRRELVAGLREVVRERLPDDVVAGLPALSRLRARLLLDEDDDALLELARRCARIEVRGRLTDLFWNNHKLEVELAAEPFREPGKALGLLRRGGSYYVDPDLAADLLDVEDGEATKELAGIRVEVVLRNSETAEEWLVPAKLELRVDEGADTGDGIRCRLMFRGSASFDTGRLAGRRPLEKGTWEVWVGVHLLGLRRRTPLRGAGSGHLAAACRPAILGKPAHVVIPYLARTGGPTGRPGKHAGERAGETTGDLRLDVDRHRRTLAAAIGGRDVRPEPGNGRRLELTLSIVSQRGSASLPAYVVLRGTEEPSTSCVLPARLESAGSRVRLVTDLGNASGPLLRLRGGSWLLAGQLDGVASPEVPLGKVDVGHRSRVYLVGAERIGVLADLARRVARAAVARPGLRRLGVRVVDHLPEQLRLRVREVVRRAKADRASWAR